MAYNPVTDFLALLRTTSGGQRVARIPGLDYVVAALARAGVFTVSNSTTAPTTNQESTVWLKPFAQGSYLAESTVFLWNTITLAYEPATPQLWAALFSQQVVQTVTAGVSVAVLERAGVVQVNQTVSAPITLVMPQSIAKVGGVLISDWKGVSSGFPITVQRSGSDLFPGGATTWTIQGDGASAMFRPVPGGYAV